MDKDKKGKWRGDFGKLVSFRVASIEDSEIRIGKFAGSICFDFGVVAEERRIRLNRIDGHGSSGWRVRMFGCSCVRRTWNVFSMNIEID